MVSGELMRLRRGCATETRGSFSGRLVREMGAPGGAESACTAATSPARKEEH